MSDNMFPQALSKVLLEEGGYTNNPHDPGGATDYGITQHEYDHWRQAHGLPVTAVRNIAKAEVTTIYHDRYWMPIHGDQLPPGVDYVVFDGGVNSGTGRSAEWLQRALGVADDGIIGPHTLGAALSQNRDQLIDAICDQRLAFLKGLSNWVYFGHGWGSRVERVRAAGKAMAV